MKKILIINPSDHMFTEINGSNHAYNVKVFPFGMALIETYLKEKVGIKVDIVSIDGKLLPHNSEAWLEDIIHSERPDIIFIIINILTYHLWSHRIEELKKEYGFDLVALINQPFAEDLINNYGHIDAVIYKEWLMLSEGIIDALLNNESFESVEGIYLMMGGKARITGKCNHLPLSNYPVIDYSLYDLNEYDLFPILWSDGCSYKCNYCFFGLYPESGWEGRGVSNVLSELKMITDNGREAASLYVMDNEFTNNKKYAKELLKALSTCRYDLSILANTRANKIDEDLARFARIAGIDTLGIGIESGSQRVLDANNKGITLTQIRDAAEIIHRHKIMLQAYIQVGLYSECEKEFYKTIDYVTNEMNIERVALSVTIPFPGTLMEKELLTRGWMSERLKINDVVWIYKNIYKYPFLKHANVERMPDWKVSDNFHIKRIIELFFEYQDKLPNKPYRRPLLKRLTRKIRNMIRT